jgi:hypothetical protein
MHTKLSTVAGAPIWVFQDDCALKDIHESPTVRAKPGPVSQLERRMEQVKLLPRKKQQLVIEFLDAIISTETA